MNANGVKRTLSARTTGNGAARRAFTLVELLAVVAVLFMLISVLAPGLTRTKPTGQAIQCLSNARRLAVTWQMYAQDNNERLVNVFHGGEAQGGNFDPLLGPGWAEGWLDWSTSQDNTNETFLLDQKYSKFAAYLSPTPNVFRCPSDSFLSSPQRARGWTHRARSYSINVTVGDGNAPQGPWDASYRQVKKMSDMAFPSPGQTWLFLDEHPDSMNDPAFFSPHQSSWVDFPATYHNGATTFSFADAHVEMHSWEASVAARRYAEVHGTSGDVNFTVEPGDPDIHWMSYHSQRQTTNSY